MKNCFIAFMIVNEVVDESTGEKWPVLKPHTHPVFTGEVAYDLGEEQEIQVCEELGVREFLSKGEAIQALNDYFREESKAKEPNIVPVEPFYLLEHIHMNNELVVRTNKKVATKKVK